MDDRRLAIKRVEDQHGVTECYLLGVERENEKTKNVRHHMGAVMEDGRIFHACAMVILSSVYIKIHHRYS